MAHRLCRRARPGPFPALAASCRARAHSAPRPPQNEQFVLGPRHSGAPLHFHGPAWNALMTGRKRWVLLPPSEARYSREPAASWFAETWPALRSELDARNASYVEFAQEAGDIVVAPEHWAHAVLNLADSLAVAVEMVNHHGQSERRRVLV